MLLRQLRYFATVAQQGSVIRAARELHLAQPALSRQMHQLEESVGTPLLERERRGVRLTPAGETLLGRLPALFVRLDESFRRTRLANEGRLGRLRIGLGRVALDSTRVGHAIVALRQQLPDVQLIINEVPSTSHTEKLRHGEIDLAIGLDNLGDTSMTKLALYEVHVNCAVVAESDPLATASSLNAAQLREKMLHLVDPAALGSMPVLYDALRGLGITRWTIHESIESVYNQVAAGRGWTLAPSTNKESPPNGTVVIPITGLDVPLPVTLRWRSRDASALIANVTTVLHRAITPGPRARPISLPRQRAQNESDAAPRELELRHLRALQVCVEQGSLSRAAEHLGLTQSGVSRQIRTLEREVGFPLLQRDGRGVLPNAAGEVLLSEAHMALALVDDALAYTRRTARGLAGRCTIGCVAAEFTGEILVQAMKHLADAYPAISVGVSEMLTPQQIAGLRDGRIDVGIAGANAGVMDDPDIAGVRLVEDVIECALLAETHPLAGRAWLKPADLADVPFLFLERSVHPKFYDAVMHAFQGIGLVPRVTGSFNGPRTLWRSAADSMGWTLGSRSVRAKPLPGLVAIPIQGLSISSGLQLLWRRDEADPAILAVIDAFRQTRNGETGVA